jgi:putative transposase
MPRKKHTEPEIQRILKEVEAGASVASVARAHGITEQTIYRWRNRAEGECINHHEELRALQAENQRLKRIVARQALEIDAYREVTDKTW